MPADLHRQGLGFEAAAAACGTNLGFDRFFVFDLRGAGYAQPTAIGAGALFTVKGKQPRVKRFQTDPAGRAGSGKAEDFLASTAVQKRETAVARFQGFVHQAPKIFRRQISDDQFDGVLVIAAQGHAFFECGHAAVDAGLLKSIFQGPGQHFLVKSLAPKNLGGQDRSRPFGIAFAELLDDGGPTLRRQLPTASRAMLAAQFAE